MCGASIRGLSSRCGGGEAADSLEGKTVHAVVGISHPERFFNTLKSLGVVIIPHEFPDHYPFTIADVSFGDNLPVVMTEKDAVKLDKRGLPESLCWYLEVEACFDIAQVDTLLRKAGIDTTQHTDGG